MINVYIGEQNLPKDRKFIFDPLPLLSLAKVPDTSFVRKVISDIDRGEYYDDRFFTSRFGGQLWYKDLSAGSSTLLVMYLYPDYVINGIELGTNALAYISLLEECSVYFFQYSKAVEFIRDVPVCVNGHVYASYRESIPAWR